MCGPGHIQEKDVDVDTPAVIMVTRNDVTGVFPVSFSLFLTEVCVDVDTPAGIITAADTT